MSTNAKRFDALVFIGRFQPMHRGHLDVLRRALSLADTVCVLIGSVAPFNPYDARVNTKAMSLETTVANPVQRVVLTDGAIGFLRFDATHGSNALVALTLPSGKEVPFGASVIDLTSGKELGIVGEHGVVYLAGIRPDTVLSVRQADQAVCNIGPLSQPLHLTPDPIPMSCVASAHPTPTPSS